MKITQLETLCLSRWHEPERQWTTARYRTVKADCAIVVISTDEGLQGIGEACAYGVPGRIREWVDWLGPELVGRDPDIRKVLDEAHVNAVFDPQRQLAHTGAIIDRALAVRPRVPAAPPLLDS